MSSIALEEAGIAHILNAEGEKIQAAIANTKDIGKMIEINASVADMLRNVNNLEQTLLAKLRLITELVRGERELSTSNRVMGMPDTATGIAPSIT